MIDKKGGKGLEKGKMYQKSFINLTKMAIYSIPWCFFRYFSAVIVSELMRQL